MYYLPLSYNVNVLIRTYYTFIDWKNNKIKAYLPSLFTGTTNCLIKIHCVKLLCLPLILNLRINWIKHCMQICRVGYTAMSSIVLCPKVKLGPTHGHLRAVSEWYHNYYNRSEYLRYYMERDTTDNVAVNPVRLNYHC